MIKAQKIAKLVELTLVTFLLVSVSAIELLAATGGYHRSAAWENTESRAEAKGLFVSEHTSGGNVKRLLVAGPAEEWIIFEQVVDARAGTIVYRAIEDETGWWLSVSLDVNRSTQSVETFFRSFSPGEEGEAWATATFTLETADGDRFTTAPISLEKGFPERFLVALGAWDGAETLRKRIPAPLRRIGSMVRQADRQISYLEVAKKAPANVATEVVLGIIAGENGSTGEWRLSSFEPIRRGVVVSDPDLVALLGAFTSIPSNVDPLAGRRVADLFSDAVPTDH